MNLVYLRFLLYNQDNFYCFSNIPCKSYNLLRMEKFELLEMYLFSFSNPIRFVQSQHDAQRYGYFSLTVPMYKTCLVIRKIQKSTNISKRTARQSSITACSLLFLFFIKSFCNSLMVQIDENICPKNHHHNFSIILELSNIQVHALDQ
jgi:hypothetical protein